MLFAPLLLLISVAQALPWDGAKPTRNIGHPLRYHEPPKPTEVIDLRKRQAPGDITCAWENGEGTSVYDLYCASQEVCATNSLSMFGCCTMANLDSCGLVTTCIDNSAIASYSSNYGYDSWALLCTNAQNPICVTRHLELNNIVTGWGCGGSTDAETLTFYSTYWNKTATTITPVIYHNAAYFDYSSLSPITPSTSTTPTTSTTSPTPVTPTPTSTSMETSTPTPTPAAASPAPIGAIVGGAIGGVAVIGGLALLAFFLFRRSRRQDNIQRPYSGGAAPMQQLQDPTQPVHFPHYPTQSGYTQPPIPTDLASHPEKLTVQGSPPIGSPNSASQERSSIPPYSPAASELASTMRVHELGE